MARTTLGDLRSRREPEQPDPYDPRGVPVPPGYQERLGDPTKVITDLPPTLNAPMRREAGPYEDKTNQAPVLNPLDKFFTPTVPSPTRPNQQRTPLLPRKPYGERLGSITPRMQLSMNDLGPDWEPVDLSAPAPKPDYRPEPREMTPDETARNRADAAFEKPGAQSHVAENARSAAAERTSRAANPVGGRRGEMGSPGSSLSPETLAELLRFLGGAR